MLFGVLAGFHGLLMDCIASHILTKIKQKQSLSSWKGGAHHENQAMLFRTFAVYIKLCRMKPRVLNLIGACAMALPLSVWIATEVAIRVIPGCKAQMYGDNLCFVGSINLAAPLIVAGAGGITIFFVLTAFVAAPLFVIAAVVSWRTKRKKHAA